MSNDFSIQITFPDGKVSLGNDDELFVEPLDGDVGVVLNDERLSLIREIQNVQAGHIYG